MSAMVKFFGTGAACLFAVVTVPASAHHSMAEYDRSTVTEVEGEVVTVEWRNPHILIELAPTGGSGEQDVWYLEGAAVSAQRRHGVEGGQIHVGDHVRVAGSPSIRRPRHMMVNHVLLPSGVELLVGSVRAPRWSSTSIGSETDVVDADESATPDVHGLFRVWSQGTAAWFFPGRVSYPLTESAARAQAAWDDIADNPLLKCTPPGMPSIMGNPYPMEFVEQDGNVELRLEEFDTVRTIHLRDAEAAASMPSAPLGYSVGHWEGDTLIVRTTKIDWPYFNRVGAPQSPGVVVDERFTPSADGARLDYEMTVTDPPTLTQPFVWKAYWTWRPGEVVGRYDCTVE
jgi:hypothetical protein